MERKNCAVDSTCTEWPSKSENLVLFIQSDNLWINNDTKSSETLHKVSNVFSVSATSCKREFQTTTSWSTFCYRSVMWWKFRQFGSYRRITLLSSTVQNFQYSSEHAAEELPRQHNQFQVENWNSCLQLLADTLNFLYESLYKFLDNFMILLKQWTF